MASTACGKSTGRTLFVGKRIPVGFPLRRFQGLARRSSREEWTQLDSSTPLPSESRYDPSLPFQTAVERLKELLEAASWESEEEQLRYEVANLVPEMKLTLFTNLGSVLTLAAFVTSWLTGEDPLGGFALRDNSLGAAAVGAGYALPLVLCSVVSRLSPVRHNFPVLDDLQDSQQEIVKPIVEDLNASQLLILASVVVVPSMLLLLPAFHGALTVAGQILTADLVPPLGMHLHLPDVLRRQAGVLVPAVCSAYFAAWVVTRQLDVNDQQVMAIRDALESADRYFLHAAAERVAERPDILQRQSTSQQQWPSEAPGLATSFASVTGASHGSFDEAIHDTPYNGSYSYGPLRQLGAEMSHAFKMVSILWLMTRRKAARLAYVLTALNVVYFGIIWHQTRDLSTPVVAALLATLTELFLIKHFPRKKGSPTNRSNGDVNAS
ncbi:hypothetical protein Vafri_14451 [Volvox africanus]|uniref:Uncharacterized protein n=1 Tax=Volvox africanus TaxID=51714 RepID=A0A8J4BE96_9CHLO|nr:hypothetical protein Vafri_14451 [Volvox africanus]